MVTWALLLGLFLIILFLACRRPHGLPPGVWGLPIVGRLPSGSENLAHQVLKLRKVYGDIITWKMGSRINVFLCDNNTIKNALKRPEFSDRPNFYTYSRVSDGKMLGLLFSSGDLWQRNRRFTIRQLRDLGMGKSDLEMAMQDEARMLVEDFRKHTGKNQPLPLSIGVAVLNMVWKMVADTRYELDDPKAQDFIRLVNSTAHKFQGPVFLFDIFPWLGSIAPPFLKKRWGYYDIQKNMDDVFVMIEKSISEHQKVFDPDDPKDLIDFYLMNQKEYEKSDQNDNKLSEKDLKAMVTELFLAGTETTYSALRWTLLYLAKYPQVQVRLQKDIDSLIPKNGFIDYHERSKLPYLEAVINEVQRNVSLVPMSVAHVASQDTHLEGFSIPKGTVIFPFLECAHKDPKLWSNPDLFNPDRFLNQDGSFNSKKDGLMPFSVGKRSCAGESLARVELFVYLTALFRNFSFALSPGEEATTEKDPNVILINVPQPYRIIYTERE